MTARREIPVVVRKVRRDELDEDAERLADWRGRTAAERIAEVESLRRLWIEITRGSGRSDGARRSSPPARRARDPAAALSAGAARATWGTATSSITRTTR
jgi:hypothetical protein